MNSHILNVKKHSGVLAKLVTTAHMQEHGVECYFNNASTAISFGHSRSEILGALKKDISKTAEDLFKGQDIINSTKAGRVIEFDSVYNTAEDVFGLAFDKDANTVTLSSVTFDLNNKVKYTKAQLAEIIYSNIFGIDAKELSATVKAITRYEDATLDIDKAVLFPSLTKADEMIKKITDEDIKYSSYRSGMDYNQRVAFDSTFNRTGIDGVIQNSTYIDETGIRQIVSSHNKDDAKELEFALTTARFKYVDAVEIDGDGDVSKALRAIRQIERLEINTKVKFTLKFRKLGNLNATGVCMSGQRIVAEDVRDTSALLHEIAHHVHLITLKNNKFVNYMISKLSPMINLANVRDESKEWASKKTDYFHEDTEIVARALEIASLFAQEQGRMISGDDEFMMVKRRSHYEEMEGIYFNFTQFDEKTIEEFNALFNLFFNTLPNTTDVSYYDNFVKIDTNYTRAELSMGDILRREAKKADSSKRALYAMVNPQNINIIIENRDKVSISELATTIMTNISYCGNHNARMTATDWADAIEQKASVVFALIRALESNLSKKEYISYLVESKAHAWKSVLSTVFLSGFSSDKFRMALRKELKERSSDAYFDIAAFKKLVMDEHPITLADKEILEDKKFIKSLIDDYADTARYINASLLSIDLLREYMVYAFGDKPSSFLINKALCDDKETMDYLIANCHTGYLSAGDGYKNNPIAMKNALDNLGYPFHHLGDKLRDNKEFVTPYVKANPALLENISSRLQKDPDILGLFDNEQREIDSLEGATTSYRRKIARSTQSIKVLAYLAKDRNYDIRIEVAKNDFTAVGTLMDLVKLKNTWVKAAVAGNKNTPMLILEKLLKECKDIYVVQALAENPKMTPQKLLRLSEQDNRQVRWSVLRNPNIQQLSFDVKIHREIMRNCLKNDEEFFHYEIRTGSNFTGSYKFFDDIINNVELYFAIGGYESAFVEMATGIRDHMFSQGDSVKQKTQKQLLEEDFETLVEAEVSDKEPKNFDSLIEGGELVDFERTDGKGTEKVLVIKNEIEDFKSFNQYMKSSKKGYYSRIAKGFILYSEFANELFKKLSNSIDDTTSQAATVAATLYSADMLQNFANGTLF